MANERKSRVVFVERIGVDVIIEFDDGESALFSASLLRSMLPKAQKLRSLTKAASVVTASNLKNAEQSP